MGSASLFAAVLVTKRGSGSTLSKEIIFLWAANCVGSYLCWCLGAVYGWVVASIATASYCLFVRVGCEARATTAERCYAHATTLLAHSLPPNCAAAGDLLPFTRYLETRRPSD